jgi:hypothetical protein
MSIEPIGLLTVIAGLLCLLLGHRSAFAILVVATLFGAAAAILVGPANIQPAHLLLASNVGVPGTVFYLLFIASAFGRRRGSPRTFPTDVRLAARNACVGLIIGDIFAAPTVEQGLLFYVLAGVACAEPERDTEELSIGSRGLTGAGA